MVSGIHRGADNASAVVYKVSLLFQMRPDVYSDPILLRILMKIWEGAIMKWSDGKME